MESKYQNLQHKKTGSRANGQVWSIENIKDGLEYFKDLYGHYPTSREVDTFDYLPSARSIQRTYGGLVQVRKQLGLSGHVDHREGAVRSEKAREADSRAREYEKEFFHFLISKVSETRVHEHKVIRPGQTSCDFFIYTADTKGVVLDLFYAADIFNVSGVVNIKYKKYVDVEFPVLFIVMGNDSITQASIDRMVDNKKIPLPSFMKVITERNFRTNFDKFIHIKK